MLLLCICIGAVMGVLLIVERRTAEKRKADRRRAVSEAFRRMAPKD